MAMEDELWPMDARRGRALANADEMVARRSSGAASRTSGAGRSMSPAMEEAAAATLRGEGEGGEGEFED